MEEEKRKEAGDADTMDDGGEVDNLDESDNVKVYSVPQELHNLRIDAIMSALEPELSRSFCSSLVSSGKVAIQQQSPPESTSKKDNNFVVTTRKSMKLEEGTILRVTYVVEEKITEIIPQDLPLNILFEDEHMIVLNKAAGMVVHPAAGNWDGTVVNALAYYLANNSPFGSGEFVNTDENNVASSSQTDNDTDSGEALIFRPGIVHRLDKGTTGILVVAKTRAALASLSEAFAARQVKKSYLAITVGNPGKKVVINKPIGRHPLFRQRMRVVPESNGRHQIRAPQNQSHTTTKRLGKVKTQLKKSPMQTGRNALSYVDTLAFNEKLSVAQVRIETGRTHQIRVHLKDRHTPVYGDDVYGLPDWNKRLKKSYNIERPLLHAFRLEIKHPFTDETLIFQAPMADDMTQIANLIWPEGKNERPDIFDPSSTTKK
eukprot:CAMPEP_0197825590 /NCGR_PEP_ID=MMETSP1437-20131217/2634_1 /TAXON_ID=49252 ORGANISM="Eucampia antarctica, Strain CCMP1452" /NCGR_SAMPLE_ID=MMETSP1437 /ASSEMBLY_ACC=CAM_ASM_001096 /LENGTH=430 /DNA_ID=CAMNT_0043425641 /DNA_START=277 /DNA_END=1569 /DNA_ORIENTATION=-